MERYRNHDVEVKTNDGWLLVDGIRSLKDGCVFRIWGKNDVVLNSDGQPKEFTADGEPYYDNEIQQWVVAIIDPISE